MKRERRNGGICGEADGAFAAVQAALSPAETSLIEARVNALIRTAARIAAPDAGTTAREHQPAKAALPGR